VPYRNENTRLPAQSETATGSMEMSDVNDVIHIFL
jgi:hypothetical protein